MGQCTVTLPCKMGDIAWGIRKYKGCQRINSGIVNQMYFGEDMRLCISVKNVTMGEWGKKIFPTKEAAEAYLGGGKNA